MWTRALAGCLCLLGGLVLATGCAREEDPAQCQRDPDCGPGVACLAHLCVARVGANPEVWSVEVAPGAQPRYAPREFPDLAFTQTPPDLVLDRRILMAMALVDKTPDPSIDRSSSVHVVFSVASAIAGRGELQFEGEAMSTGPTYPYNANVPIPAMLVNTAARMTVIPIAPLDRSMPPWLLPVTLDTTLPPLPLPSGFEVVVLDGKLEPADPQAPLEVPYQARARVGGQPVSNTAVTDEHGVFTLRMQRSVLPGDGAGLTIEVRPLDDMEARPSLLLSTVDINKNALPALRLPAFQKPEAYVVPVVGGPDKRPVVGATVRFRATLPSGGVGDAFYERVAQTGPMGTAMIPLIPGASQATRDYVVQVSPPADSDFAAGCVASYAIGPATTSGQRVGAAIELAPKITIEGRVLRADGKPAASVRVRPTLITGASAEGCGGVLASAASEQNTDVDGRYRLRLDPGQYRLDIEPPQGTPLPSTSTVVTVPETRTADVVLPSPVLVEGRVLSPNRTPAADAEVRAFGKDAMGVTFRRAVALTDAEGKFRLIVPRLP
jgi:hypothetical protein